MDSLEVGDYKLKNLSTINIILGKNGSGKSRLLRFVEGGIANQPEIYGRVKYITPERGGTLVYQAGSEENLAGDRAWLPGQRRHNQAGNFRQLSVAQYRELESLILREIEHEKREDLDYTFDQYVDKINSLLDNIEIKRERPAFKIYQKGTTSLLNADDISSGESELISLGIECLIFSKECIEGKDNFLFLDEPDVHLHPDLQVRLMRFLQTLTSETYFKILIATHSTAILGALESYSETSLAFLESGQKEISFEKISDAYRKILPVFGAHPLSNIFNEAPILLLEGEDDERIWQQVVRSSGGLFKLYPISVGSLSRMNRFEQEARKIIRTVYDEAVGYSLRDKDDSTNEINDLPPVVRMKLSCRNAENLLLSDEALDELGTNWEELERGIKVWLSKNNKHPHFSVMQEFKTSGFERKNYDIKKIRIDLMGIMGSMKPWEIVVGKAIAKLRWHNSINFNEPNKLISYLGEKVVKNLIPKLSI